MSAAIVRTFCLAHPLVVAAACALIVRVASIAHVWYRVERSRAAVTAVLVTFVAIGTWYLSVPTFADHAEPAVAAVSWLLTRGESPYPAAGEVRYSFPYGPGLYIVTAAFQRAFGATLIVSKLPFVLASVACLLIVAVALRRRVVSAPAVAAAAIGLLAFGSACFWCRPEPLLLLAVSIGLLAMTVSAPADGLLLGLALGLSLAVKVTGPLYLAPVLAYAWADTRRSSLLMAGAIGVLTFGLCFLPEAVPWSAYWSWVLSATHHGIRWRSLPSMLEWAAVLALPVALARGRTDAADADQHRTETPTRVGGAALALCLFGSTVLAAKQGTGAHHFLPFVPTVVWLAARRRSDSTRSPLHAALTRGCVAALLVAAGLQQVAWIRTAASTANQAMVAEVTRAIETVPGPVAVGYSTAYRASYLRPLAVFAGNPYPFDAVALMDGAVAGVAFPSTLTREMAACRIRVWLVPAGGEPFVLRNAYRPAEAVFPPAFLAAFHAHYARASRGRFYDVWSCREPG